MSVRTTPFMILQFVADRHRIGESFVSCYLIVLALVLFHLASRRPRPPSPPPLPPLLYTS